MMDFINPHAILIKPENFEEILSTIYMQDTNDLTEIYVESVEDDMRRYIVGWRDSVNGWPCWKQVTEVELACEYRLKTVNQFWKHFTRI